MTNIPEERLAKVGKLFRQQLVYIQQNGCNGIKCKQCCLLNMCTREPAKSKSLASFVLAQSISETLKKKS